SGSLFEGVFKAVLVETDEQLLHLTRYIHLNPVVSNLITPNKLIEFPWSSYSVYLGKNGGDVVDKNSLNVILDQVRDYNTFVMEHV
ncbi:hypothetical protein ACQ7B2_24400, partial [Escherichia coli]